jgi:hypothetical protein
MPQGFTKCVKDGGKVVTEKISNTRYRHVCYDKNNNKFEGEIKIKKRSQSNSRRNRAKKKIEESRNLVEELKRLQQHFNENFHSK